MHFADLNLIDPLLRAVAAEGYDTPTPIQQQAIPHVLTGRDLIGCAQTGTGKTAAFALPILQLLALKPAQSQRRVIRALVLSPTRELASQIGDNFTSYGRHTGLRTAVIFGGVGQTPQVDLLKRGIDILVATPGRLLDLMGQGYISLSHLEVFVLDEADRMLDMGFIHDVRKVLK
ncbi:MAG: DEAD/DEAH box helicase, partial [Anaerolineae bacterium]|nr:DEAD/DEAH box helicase [Anaerolineae bacterium]